MYKKSKNYAFLFQVLCILFSGNSIKAVEHNKIILNNNDSEKLEKNYKTFILKILPYLQECVDSIPIENNYFDHIKKEPINIFEKISIIIANDNFRYPFTEDGINEWNLWSKRSGTKLDDVARRLGKSILMLKKYLDNFYNDYKNIVPGRLMEYEVELIQKCILLIDKELDFNHTTSIDQKNKKFENLFQNNGDWNTVI